MEILFERHLEYLSDVPTSFERELMKTIDWESRLTLIRGPKGVGKSTLMLQYILKNYGASDRHVLYCSADTGYFTTHTLLDTVSAFVRQGAILAATSYFLYACYPVFTVTGLSSIKPMVCCLRI